MELKYMIVRCSSLILDLIPCCAHPSDLPLGGHIRLPGCHGRAGQGVGGKVEACGRASRDGGLTDARGRYISH
jgi:hypothetical protein